MEVTVSDQIIQVLDALCDKFGLAIDWGAQNVLPYAQELMSKMVSYELWTSIMWIVVFAIFMALSGGSAMHILKQPEAEVEEFEAGLFIVLMIIFMVFFLCVVWQVTDIITCLTFPEKIVFEMMQNMMK